jgi:hypothetical protein
VTLVAASGAASAALTRLSDSLTGTGPMFAQLAAFGLIAIALGAGARAAMLWMEVHQAARVAARAVPAAPATTAAAMTPAAMVAAGRDAGVPPRIQDAAEPVAIPHRSTALLRAVAQRLRAAPRARASRGRRHTPQSVRQLADAGAARPEIARRTGLSQDAVGLALHLGSRQA